MKLSNTEAMQMAIEVAKKGAGFVSPNPLVGCVVLNPHGDFISSGYHEVYGGPHAEIQALKNLTPEQLLGARVFVTLEPCSHHGKTPPCAEKLASLPLGEVVYGLTDPNPLVSGKGAEKIRTAGIKTTLYRDLCPEDLHTQKELYQLCEVFLFNQLYQKPFVSLKVATSLDAMLGLKSGESKWITGEISRQHSHFLRATHDGVVIGVNTLIQDNPSLNIRSPQFADKKNKVLILDPHGKGLSLIQNSLLYKNHPADFIFVFVLEDICKNIALDKFPFKIVSCPSLKSNQNKTLQGEPIDLSQFLEITWSLGFKSLLVEGGALTLSSFIEQKIAQRIYQFIAPSFIGGKNGKIFTESLFVNQLNEKVILENLSSQKMGEDLLISATFKNQYLPLDEKSNVSDTGSQILTAIEASTQTSLNSSTESQNKNTHENFEQNTTSESIRFYRSPHGIFLGVCQGLGESFAFPVPILRLLTFISFFYFAIGIGLYLALAICLPRKDQFDKVFKRQLLGVCASISKRSNIEVGVVRLMALLLFFFTGGLAFLAYVILYFAFED